MGTWGPGIFEDDRALDVRDEWVQLLKDGVSPEEATAKVWETYGIDDPVVILALAATQWEWGRLNDRVGGEALRVLRDGRALEGWDNDLRRKRQVDALEKKLNQAPPPPRPVRVMAVPEDWQLGELLSWRLVDGRRTVLRVVDTERYGRTLAPVCELMDWYALKDPSSREARFLGPRRVANPPRGEDGAAGRNLFFSLGVFEAGEYPHRRLRRLRFRTETPPSSPVKSFGVPWRELDTFLAARFVVGWTQGTIVALRTKNDRLFLLRVTQVKEMHLPDLEIGIEVLDWKERDAPRVGQLDSLKPCRSRKDPERTMSAIALGPVHAPERLSVVGYLPMSESTQRSGRVALEWGQLEEWLANDNPRL